MNNVYWIFIIITVLVIALCGRCYITQRKLSALTGLVWLSLIIFQTLIFSSPLVLFFIFIGIFIIKLYMHSNFWQGFMKYSLYLLIFMIIFNLILVQSGTTVLWELAGFKITEKSLLFSYSMGMRIIIMIGAFAIFNSNESTDDLFTIFEKLRIPEKAYMTLVTSFRFFEIMSREAKDSVDAFRVRGIPISSGSIKERIKYRYPIMASLLKNSLDRAMDIAETMEVRGFPSSERKSWKDSHLSVKDMIIVIFLILMIGISIIYALFPKSTGIWMVFILGLGQTIIVVFGGNEHD